MKKEIDLRSLLRIGILIENEIPKDSKTDAWFNGSLKKNFSHEKLMGIRDYSLIFKY